MKRNKIFLKITLLLIGILNSINSFSQYWTQLDDFSSVERDDAASFTIGKKTYCGTGMTPWFSSLGDFYCFDPTNATWSSISALPSGEERQYSSGFSKGNKGYVFGGLNASNYLNDLWEYDTVTNTWTEKSPLPAVGRSGMTCFVIGDTAYIIGGKTFSSFAISEVWAYCFTTDTWQQKNDLPFGGRWRAGAASNDTNGFMLFGKNELSESLNDFHIYDPQTDSWTALGSFTTTGRSYNSFILFNNELYSLFGIDESNNLQKDLWKYNIENNSWTQLEDLPSDERKGGVAFASSDKIYYATGISSTERLKEVWMYKPVIGIFEMSEDQLRVFPNPTIDQIHLGKIDDILSIQLVDQMGKIAMKPEVASIINVSGLSSGNYVISILTSQGVFHQKLLISK